MTADQRPLAFVYDRCATGNRVALELRLKVCQEYATQHGWSLAGWWLDRGDQALTFDQRPAFDRLLTTMCFTALSTPRVCLIHDWGRFAHGFEGRTLLTRRVLALGAWVQTCGGDKRTPDGWQTQHARLTDGPVIR